MTNENHPVTIHTGAACRGNPGPGGWSAILRKGAREKIFTGFESITTNQRMELTAAISGLKALKRPTHVVIITDSKSLADGITQWIETWQRNDWQNSSGNPVANTDLWKNLLVLNQTHQTIWEWVSARSGDTENNRADQHARQALLKNIR
ncbi:ribonuclease HI [Thalassospira australica]|uniref:ribonuclease HI n=1 Tax=Thalassospira australica TaxID=1528106 RepID=UPI00384C9AE5